MCFKKDAPTAQVAAAVNPADSLTTTGSAVRGGVATTQAKTSGGVSVRKAATSSRKSNSSGLGL